MKKKVFLSLVLFLSLIVNTLCVSAIDLNETDAVVPVYCNEKTLQIISDFWGDGFPYGDFDYESSSPIYVHDLIRIDNPTLELEVVSLVDSNGTEAYFVVDLTREMVQEFCESASPYSQCDPNNIWYYGPLQYFEADPDQSNLLSEVGSSATYDLNDYNFDVSEKSSVNSNQAQNLYPSTPLEYETASSTYPDNLMIENVPDYQQSNGYKCINTSILNVIAYKDSNGFPDLIADTVTISTVRSRIQSCLENNGGAGKNTSVQGAIEEYLSTYTNYDSYIEMMFSPTFHDLKFEIKYGDPCLVGFPTYYGNPHMTTGVGYKISSTSSIEYVIVHDNHSTTGVNVTIPFAEVDYICGIQFIDLN